MPNWCCNRITVYGDVDEVVDFIGRASRNRSRREGNKEGDWVEESVFSMDALLPCPKPLRDSTATSWSEDEPHKYAEYLADPDNEVWTQEVYDMRMARWNKDAKVYRYNLKKYGCLSWYEWQIANWGTKWDADVSPNNKWEQFEYAYPGDGTTPHITYHANALCFMTAWSPPEAFFKTISKQFPGLGFLLDYAEPGCDFSGQTLFRDGTTIREKIGNYDSYCVELGFEEEGYREEWE